MRACLAGAVGAFGTKHLDAMDAIEGVEVVSIVGAEYLRETGSEGIEAVMWLTMRGALHARVNEVYRFMHVPVSNTSYGLTILENAV